MSGPIQRWRGVLLVIAGALAAGALVAEIARMGRVAWAGVVVLLVAFAGWLEARSAAGMRPDASPRPGRRGR